MSECLNIDECVCPRRIRMTGSDMMGLALSALCALHCLLLPLAAASLPFLTPLADHADWAHWALLAGAAVTGWFALRRSLRDRRYGRALGFGAAAGFLVLGLGAYSHGRSWAPWETALSLTGASLLAVVHIANIVIARDGLRQPARSR